MNDGEIEILADGGGTYTYALTGWNEAAPDLSAYSEFNRFAGLLPGVYDGYARDSASGCVFLIDNIELPAREPARPGIAATGPPRCHNSADGWVVLSAEKENPGPLEYSRDGGINFFPFSPGDTLRGFGGGQHDIIVRDTNGCVEPDPPLSFRLDAPAEFRFATGRSPELDPPSCPGRDDGAITFFLEGGTQPYEYRMRSPEDRAWQSSNVFDGLPAGVYEFEFRDANGCLYTTNPGGGFRLEDPEPFVITLETEPPVCTDEGRIFNIQAENGTPPLEFSLDGDAWQPENEFANLPGGAYTVYVRDANGCSGRTDVTLPPANTFDFFARGVDPVCPDLDNGRIQALIEDFEDYEFRLSGEEDRPFQADSAFTGLPPGDYVVTVRNRASGCEDTQILTLNAPDLPVFEQIIIEIDTCGGLADIIAALTPGTGTPPFNYSLNRAPFGPSPLFGDLPSGTYQIRARDENQCLVDTVFELEIPDTFSIDTTISQPACGRNDGAITVVASGAPGPFGYSFNQGPVSPSGDFAGLGAGVYRITVYDSSTSAVCEKSFDVELRDPGAPEAVQVITQPVCADDGVIELTDPQGGSPPYEYALNSNADADFGPGPGAVFENLGAGDYVVYIRDADGCENAYSITLDPPDIFSVSFANITQPTCAENGSLAIEVRIDGAPQPAGDYEYALGEDEDANYGANPAFGNLAGGTLEFFVRNADGCVVGPVAISLNAPQPLAFTDLAPQDATCEGQTDGSVAFETNWPNIAITEIFLNGDPRQLPLDGLAEGAYSLRVVNEAGCEAETTFTIAAAPGFDVAARATPADCGEQGAITLAVTPEDPQNADFEFWLESDPATTYDYDNTNEIPGLGAGTYRVVARENTTGCAQTVEVIVGQSDGPFFNAEVTPAGCPGAADGAIALNPSGGNAPYALEYLDENQAYQPFDGDSTGLRAGEYRYRLTDDEDCAVDTVILLEGAPAVELTATVTNPRCADEGEILLELTGGTAPFALAEGVEDLQPGEEPDFLPFAPPAASRTGLTEGVYIFIIEDGNGCRDTAEAELRNTGSVEVTDIEITPACHGGRLDGEVVITTDAAAPATYTLQGNNFNAQVTIPDGPAATISGVPAGDYILTITGADGCDTTLDQFEVPQHPRPAYEPRGRFAGYLPRRRRRRDSARTGRYGGALRVFAGQRELRGARRRAPGPCAAARRELRILFRRRQRLRLRHQLYARQPAAAGTDYYRRNRPDLRGPVGRFYRVSRGRRAAAALLRAPGPRDSGRRDGGGERADFRRRNRRPARRDASRRRNRRAQLPRNGKRRADRAGRADPRRRPD